MRLITLNIWGGHVYQPLIEFIDSYQDVDVFCFQEVYCRAPKKITNEDRKIYLDFFSEIENLLPSHRGLFKPVVNNCYGIAMFVRNDIDILDEGEVWIHRNELYCGIGPTHSRNMQWVKALKNNQYYTILNVHGLWNGQGKTDSFDRLIQARNIKDFLDTIRTPVILCGDFNLRPDTDSLQIIKSGLNDLIEQYVVTDTRTSFYDKSERYADYVFTSKDVQVKHFSVLDDQVSDHAPLLIDFS